MDDILGRTNNSGELRKPENENERKQYYPTKGRHRLILWYNEESVNLLLTMSQDKHIKHV